MPKLGIALQASREDARRMVDEAIANSPDLLTAMESVGAMYGIPSTQILSDDNARSVKLINDHIVCPSNIRATGNTNTIVRAISGVLDQISKQVDDKLTNIQSDNIEAGKHDETLMNRTDPSKGKVVIVDKDANGEMVLVYDSGIIDCAHTPEGRAKAEELRAQGNIPAFDPLKRDKPSYFNDDDDIRTGVDMNAQPGKKPIMEYDLAAMADTEHYFIDAIAKFGDTRTLGYDVFTKHGYDCVQPMVDAYMESTQASKISPEDMKHMKFDNTNIIAAIKYFNAARAEQSNIKKVTDLDMIAFIRSPNYQKAIDCLNKQFDCRLAIKWIHADKKDSMAGTPIFDTEYRNRLTCSKSKGFQLGGSPIHIYIVEDGVADLIPEDQKLFGQSVCSILLHEIFHNIAGIMRFENGEFVTSLNIALNEASATRDPKTRRVIIEKYVDALNTKSGGKINRITRRQLVKKLCQLVTEKSDVELASQYNATTTEATSKNDRDENGVILAAERELRAYTKGYKRLVKRGKKNQKASGGIAGMIVGGTSLVLSILSFAIGVRLAGFFLLPIGLVGIGLGIADFSATAHYKKLLKTYKESKDLEEYYADLLAAMYQLPQRFFNAASKKKYSANDVNQSTLDEWVKVEREAYQSVLLASYPTTSERTYAAVTCAKNILKCQGLDPSIKEYLEWIVKNNDHILDTGIKENYNSHTFDPAEAEDLDRHLVSMVTNNNVTLTESYVEEFDEFDGEPDDNDLFLQEFCDLNDKISLICEYVEAGIYDDIDTYVSEATYSGKVTGYKDESFIKRFLLLIPRLIKRALEMIIRMLGNIARAISFGTTKAFISGKQYTIPFDLTAVTDYYEKLNNKIDEMHNLFEGTESVEDYINKMKKIAADKYKIGDVYAREIDPNDKNAGRLRSKINGKDVDFQAKELDIENGKQTTMSGDSIIRCLKTIDVICRKNIVPKLKQLNAMNDRITKKGDQTTWKVDMTNDSDLQKGYRNYRYLINELMEATRKTAIICMSATDSDNMKRVKKGADFYTDKKDSDDTESK